MRKDPVALEAARQALIKGGTNEPTAEPSSDWRAITTKPGSWRKPVLGTVVVKAQGNSPGAGGAAVGELIAAALYPDTNPTNLNQPQRIEPYRVKVNYT